MKQVMYLFFVLWQELWHTVLFSVWKVQIDFDSMQCLMIIEMSETIF